MFNPHEYLNSFVNFESNLQLHRAKDFNLARIKQLLDLLGNPEKNLRIVHVAGTKGKGSTCAFTAAILQHAGLKVGLYTSPHLHRVNERIRVLGPHNMHTREDFSGSISDEDLELVLAQMRPHIAAIQNSGGFLTYFEVLTAVALIHFVNVQVEWVVLETGLGGRLDATNAVDTLIVALTPISLDHTRILGGTLREIATEKAAIIKSSRQKVIIAPQDKEVMDVILNRCKEFGVEPIRVCPDQHELLKSSLKGKHQIGNAAVALGIIDSLKGLGVKISDQAISEGLKNVRWAGRFDVLQESPIVVVDCAHNAASAKAVARALWDTYPLRRVILVLGVSADKDVAAICAHLKDSAARIILTKAHHPRAHVFTAVEAMQYFDGKAVQLCPDIVTAMREALGHAHKQDVVLVTGSTFIVAEAMNYLLNGSTALTT